MQGKRKQLLLSLHHAYTWTDIAMQCRAIAISVIFIATLFVGTAQAKVITIKAVAGLNYDKTHITVQPGEKITIKLVNTTSMPHNYVQLSAEADASAVARAALSAGGNEYIPKDKADVILGHTSMIQHGQTDTVTFTAPKKPGDYPYICTFPGHYVSGMKGVLTVAK